MGIHQENYNSGILVEMWADFINWEKRRKGENGFLLNTLNKSHCRNVFDACLGDGADSIYLLKNGFDVTSNDLDNLFIKKARENAIKYNVTLNITEHDWRYLDRHFEGKNFDAVLCLGNSLTYLFEKKGRLKTLRNFLYILKDKGILVIDERNYQSILDKREEILKEGKFQYSGEYVYCGDKVHGRPIEISDDKVRFEYKDERTGSKGYLLLYPFKRGELLDLLKEAGFAKIEPYSDYKKGFTPDADFYQYVCIK
ncbi:MAG TPA: class I SAM-dependent methyltransferase [Nanoarchaeota archaeon]|nr:class I SAM-dependent methyltransferase [Nanoarchaeota archaeon]